MTKRVTKVMPERRLVPSDKAAVLRQELDVRGGLTPDGLRRPHAWEDVLTLIDLMLEDHRQSYWLAVRLDALLREGYCLLHRHIEWLAPAGTVIDCEWMQRVREELGLDPRLYYPGMCDTGL